ncbi:MAG: 7-carboxy-7-deazaguanine synthase QueE [Bacteroidia bacterium]|nr:7-carboxy-7-deazaguanine synthase QueE [Bacteroidia bacterium]
MKKESLLKEELKRGQADPLPVMEHFYTLQGEGAWTGEPAYFVRLAGCDVGCHWCDVKESWKVSPDQYHKGKEIANWVESSGSQRVVITGGEPTIYDLGPLTQEFSAKGIKTHIETAGVHPYTGKFDWICFSPKKFLKPREEYYQLANELKIIIYNKHDFKWAEEHAEKCHPQTQLFLQVEWTKRAELSQEIIDYIKRNPKWRLSQQTHKYLDIP